MPQLNLLSASGLASNAAVTANGVSQIQGDGNSNPFSLVLVFDVTLAGGTSPTLQLLLEAFDPVSGKFVQWGTAFTALTTTGTAAYIIALGVAAAAGGVTATVGYPPPNIWRVRVVPGGTIGTASFTVTGYVNMNLQ